jgi:putative peptidoglycan lipid II flippase
MRAMLSNLAGVKSRFAGFSLLSAGSFVIALVTYLRQAEIARLFGTSWMTDAYAVALVFPALAQQVIAHAFGSSFIPIYSDVRHRKGPEAASRLVSRILFWLSIGGAALTLLLLFYSRSLVAAAGPGLQPPVLDLSSTMLRLMLPILVLSSATGILTGLMSAQRRFGIVSILNTVNILGSLLVVVFGNSKFGIMVLPLSGLAGAVLAFACAVLAALRFGPGVYPAIDPSDADFRRLLRMSGPVVVGVLIGFLSPVVDKILASFLAESSVTALDYAIRVKDMALALLFIPISSLADVILSDRTARGDTESFRAEMGTLLNWTSFVLVPVSALLCVLAAPMVSILFMRGNFGVESTELVGRALAFYAPWLAQFGFGAIISRGFYAMKDSKTPVLIGIWSIVANVLLNIILIGPMGIAGIALATTLASGAKTVLLAHFMRRKAGSIGSGAVLKEHLKFLLAAALMTGTVLLMKALAPVELADPLGARLSRLAMWIAPSLAVYLLACRISRSATSARAFARLNALTRPGRLRVS